MLGWLVELVAAITRGDRSWRPFLVAVVVLSTAMVVIAVVVD